MNLQELINQLYDAKRAEDEAKKQRIVAEEAIAAMIETPENGSKTVDGGHGIKVTVKRGIIYDANIDAIRDITNAPVGAALPLTFVPPQPSSYAFDEKAYEALRTSSPAFFAEVAKHVTTKPRKVAVSLKIG
jgi:hypothetical protein